MSMKEQRLVNMSIKKLAVEKGGKRLPELSRQEVKSLFKAFVAENHYVSFGFIEFKKMGLSPIDNRRKASRDIREKSGEFRVSRKNAETKVVISITHAAKTSIREHIRQGGAVEVKEKRTKN